MAQLHTIESLSRELRRDRRAVAKLVDGLRPDGEQHGRRAWLLSSVMPLLDGAGTRQTSGSPRPELVEIERAADAVMRRLATLRAEPNVERRRELARAAPVPVGKLIDALDRANAGDADIVARLLRDEMIRSATGETLALLHWKYDGDCDEHRQ